MEDGFVPEVSGDSIKSLIARVSDRTVDDEFPTVSLFNFPAQVSLVIVDASFPC